MRGQPGFFNPFHGGAIQRLRLTGQKLADEKLQADGFFRIVVADFLEQFADGNFHAQFLADFADEALLESLAGFALAAWKFPKPAEMRLRVALRDEQFAFAEDERGADLNRFTIYD